MHEMGREQKLILHDDQTRSTFNKSRSKYSKTSKTDLAWSQSRRKPKPCYPNMAQLTEIK